MKQSIIYFTGQTTSHDRYFKTQKGVYEMLTGWRGEKDMDNWKMDFAQVDNNLQRFSDAKTFTAIRKEIIKMIKA